MTKQQNINRTFKFMAVLSLLTIVASFLYEHGFVKDGKRVSGEIVSFKKKSFSSAQGDSVEMKILFVVNAKQRQFYSSRNVAEQIFGTYNVGDSVPVVYNPAYYPSAKIGRPQRLYEITLTFVIMWLLFFSVLLYVRWKVAGNNSPVL